MQSDKSKELQAAWQALVQRPNRPAGGYNGIYQRWENPVLTREHVPPSWRFDFDRDTNPGCLERLGVNAVFNSGALLHNGIYHLVARVEGNDRKSFFALATSDKPTEGFVFRYPIALPDTEPREVNVYDMRLTRHEDGWIYGLFCSESKDPANPDPSAALAATGIARTKDFVVWERLPNLKSRSSQQRNVVLFPEFVQGQYALFTRPQDGFIDAGSGGGICFALCRDMEAAEIGGEALVSPRRYHTITEGKNGAGATPIKTDRGWLHIAHGVRGTAAGLRYVLYVFVTDLAEPWRVTAEPSGYFMAPLGAERLGDVSNVVFSNGAAVNEATGEVAVYYASSDTRLHVATASLEALLDYAFQTPADPGRSAACVRQREELIRKNQALLEYQRWLEHVPAEDPWRAELDALEHDIPLRTDSFYRGLSFGTGGLRASIGPGSNRMNCHVVGLATQGLLNYLKKEYNIKEEDIKEIKDDTKEIKNKIKNIINKNQKLRICISYDTRNYSREFALQAARVLLANGAEVLVYARHRPTPMLSFAVREYKAHAGIMITASHNPSEDNGYKAYNATGGQITDAASKAVEAEIGLLDVFEVYERCKNTSLESIRWLGAETDRLYYDRISEWLPRREDAKLHGGALRMIYTPLHGAGYVPVTDMLERLGYTSYTVVEEQREPDGDFPTVQKPNPEEKAVFEKALALAETACPDILFATDPDADRIGVLARDSAGSCLPLTGNQLGALLCAYLIEARGEGLLGGMPANPAVVTTIVTGTLAENICRANGVAVELVLTGFKYIGEKMDQWLATGERSFLFGFEESYGYLTGDVCRDKDAVISAALVAEMALHYKRRGMNLHEALQALYETYGAVSDALINLEARGAEGQAFILALMEDLRANAAGALPGETVVAVEDFRTGVRTDLAGNVRSAIHLPSSNVLKLFLADGSWVALRPSGTEPKIKLYLCCPGKTIAEADRRCAELRKKAETLLGIL